MKINNIGNAMEQLAVKGLKEFNVKVIENGVSIEIKDIIATEELNTIAQELIAAEGVNQNDSRVEATLFGGVRVVITFDNEAQTEEVEATEEVETVREVEGELTSEYLNKCAEYKELFEAVTGMEFTENNITEALVGITKKQVVKLMKPLKGFEYDNKYTEQGYDDRTVAEHNYSTIQTVLWCIQGDLETITW